MAPTRLSRVSAAARRPSHSDRIDAVVGGTALISGAEEVSVSWRRCMLDYRVDPQSRSTPHIITQNELRDSREPLGGIIAQAREEIDRLYAIVRHQAYVVLLCNGEGIAVHHRGDEARAEEFKRWGIWLGGVWSEQVEGTNGIGTCIAERRPVIVHGDQHYRTRHGELSCVGAPIFDPSGKLTAVLDASRIRREGSERMDPLVLAAITASARAVEERIFRERFLHAWTIAAVPADDSGLAVLLAVDEDQRVVGADRVARMAFSLNDNKLIAGVHLSMVFHYDLPLFRRNNGQDIPVRLMRAGGKGWWHILITPPLGMSGGTRSWAERIVHSQPRISTLGSLPIPDLPAVNRGGLPPGLTHRICEYIESHLDEKMGLDVLAAMAGLSTHHFARAFRQSVGMPPHSYLLRRRLQHVEQMLRDTQLPLSEIALAAGFSDHSHLARHFRRVTGMSPSLARWKER